MIGVSLPLRMVLNIESEKKKRASIFKRDKYLHNHSQNVVRIMRPPKGTHSPLLRKFQAIPYETILTRHDIFKENKYCGTSKRDLFVDIKQSRQSRARGGI